MIRDILAKTEMISAVEGEIFLSIAKNEYSWMKLILTPSHFNLGTSQLSPFLQS